MNQHLQDVIDWILSSGAVLGVIGFAWRQARIKGKLEEVIDAMRTKIATLQSCQDEHAERLSEGSKQFALLEERTKTMKETLDESVKLQREARDILFTLIGKEGIDGSNPNRKR